MQNLYPPQLLSINGESFPIGNLYCIGRNYSEHAREMGASITTDPLVFLKPSSALVPSGETVFLPTFSSLVHYEVELVVLISKDAVRISEAQASDHILGFAVGIDFTLRDIQEQAKKAGTPWALAKGFLGSAPISPYVPFAECPDMESLEISLSINGTQKQHGLAKEMEHSVPALISYLSRVFGLRRGDCIFTGTPKGVGPVESGDKLEAKLSNQASLSIVIGPADARHQ